MTAVIEVTGLTKRYGGRRGRGAQAVVDDISAVRDSWMGVTPRLEYLGIMAAYAVIAAALSARFFRWEQA